MSYLQNNGTIQLRSLDECYKCKRTYKQVELEEDICLCPNCAKVHPICHDRVKCDAVVRKRRTE